MQNDAMASQWSKDDPDNPVTQLKKWSYPYTTYVGQYTIVFDTSTDVGKIKNKAEKKWGDVLPLLLLSKSDREFDKIYNNYMKERYQMGYERVLSALTLKIQENIEKLGLDK